MKLRITKQDEGQLFYGHGKLLITGEYFVLDGATALALPTRLGQSLRVKELHSSENLLYWIALNSKKQSWLNLVFDTKDFTCINAPDQAEAQRLSKILTEARKLNPSFLSGNQDTAVETHLEFPNEWGLGSSSTLIYCIEKWAGGVDAYTLLQNTLGGSGYDVASAEHDSAILYRLENGRPVTQTIHWQPPFADNIYFAYTGKKQLSSEGIKTYREQLKDKERIANDLSSITESVLKCDTLSAFEELLDKHENIIASALNLSRIKDTLFPDYWGSVKSLGAWGGDFVLLTNTKSESDLKNYLTQKNIDTCFNWNELILAANETVKDTL
jgi:mevalonate kinase